MSALAVRLQDSLRELALRDGRVLLHAGAPKTGSTSLQQSLQAHRLLLERNGTCYAPQVRSPEDPKHAWLARGLRRREVAELETTLADAVDSALASGSTTLLLSTEGLYTSWARYADWAGTWIAAVAELVRLELWLILREPAAYYAASYQQVLRSDAPGESRAARTQSPAEALALPFMMERLDYDGFTAWWEEVLGADQVHVDLYQDDIIALARRVVGINDLPSNDHRANASLSGVGCALLREINAQPLSSQGHAAVLEHVVALDALATARRGREPILGQADADTVLAHARPGLDRLVARRPELAPLLRAPDPLP